MCFLDLVLAQAMFPQVGSGYGFVMAAQYPIVGANWPHRKFKGRGQGSGQIRPQALGPEAGQHLSQEAYSGPGPGNLPKTDPITHMLSNLGPGSWTKLAPGSLFRFVLTLGCAFVVWGFGADYDFTSWARRKLRYRQSLALFLRVVCAGCVFPRLDLARACEGICNGAGPRGQESESF